MKKSMCRYWALPAVAGLALVMAAALLSSSSPGSPGVPAASAVGTVDGEYCVLQIVKEANESEVEAGDRITYTITVTNVATAEGTTQLEGCVNPEITDVLSEDLECVSASVVDPDSLAFSQAAIDDSCQADDVDWAFVGSLKEGDQVVVRLRVETDEDLDEGDHVLNEACVTANVVAAAGFTTQRIVMEPQCDTETVRIREREREPTATPTIAPTNTPRPPLPTSTPLPPLPTAKPLATLTGPPTGTGSEGHASWPLALGLGLGGLCLLVVSGTALARKRIR